MTTNVTFWVKYDVWLDIILRDPWNPPAEKAGLPCWHTMDGCGRITKKVFYPSRWPTNSVAKKVYL